MKRFVIERHIPGVGRLDAAQYKALAAASNAAVATLAGQVQWTHSHIAADNTIRHDQIAEARISYGGRGQLSAAQRPNWGQRIADAVTPW